MVRDIVAIVAAVLFVVGLMQSAIALFLIIIELLNCLEKKARAK